MTQDTADKIAAASRRLAGPERYRIGLTGISIHQDGEQWAEFYERTDGLGMAGQLCLLTFAATPQQVLDFYNENLAVIKDADGEL